MFEQENFTFALSCKFLFSFSRENLVFIRIQRQNADSSYRIRNAAFLNQNDLVYCVPAVLTGQYPPVTGTFPKNLNFWRTCLLPVSLFSVRICWPSSTDGSSWNSWSRLWNSWRKTLSSCPSSPSPPRSASPPPGTSGSAQLTPRPGSVYFLLEIPYMKPKNMNIEVISEFLHLKGSLTWDLRPNQVFFSWIIFFQGPWVFRWDFFELLWKFAEIFELRG